MHQSTITAAPEFGELEQHRAELTAYCYRMLGSPFDAEDAVQDAFVRAWRGRDRFEGRAAMRSWLYRIATNVCLDALKSRQRRMRPMDLGPSSTADSTLGPILPEPTLYSFFSTAAPGWWSTPRRGGSSRSPITTARAT